MKEFFNNFFALNEQRVSSLVVFAIALIGVGIYMVFKVGDIPINLTNVIISVLLMITGGSAVPIISNIFTNKNTPNG